MWREGWRGMGRSKEGDMGLRKVSLATRPDWNRISDVKYTPRQIAIWVMSSEYSGASLTWFWMNSSTSGNSRSFISSEGWRWTASGPAGNNIAQHIILNIAHLPPLRFSPVFFSPPPAFSPEDLNKEIQMYQGKAPDKARAVFALSHRRMPRPKVCENNSCSLWWG